MKQLRFIVGVIKGIIPMVLYHVPKANIMIRFPKVFNDEQCYKAALGIVHLERRMAITTTDVFGQENLPEEGGFIMYSNHQGKYDALGILASQKRPISILWDVRSAKHIVAKQVSKLLHCQIIDNKSGANFIPVMQAIAKETQNGKPYLIFPEGTYRDNKNTLIEFQTGCFMSSVLSKTPIVPVVLYDSYKAMDTNELLLPVKTQVHYLKPIPYEEYKDMNRKALCAYVKDIIQKKLDELNAEAASKSSK